MTHGDLIIHQAILHVLYRSWTRRCSAAAAWRLTAEKDRLHTGNHIRKKAQPAVRCSSALTASSAPDKLEHNQFRVCPAALRGCCSITCATTPPPSPGAGMAVVRSQDSALAGHHQAELYKKQLHTHTPQGPLEGAPVQPPSPHPCRPACLLLPPRATARWEVALVQPDGLLRRLLENTTIDGHRVPTSLSLWCVSHF